MEQRLVDEKQMYADKIASLKENPSAYESEVKFLKAENFNLKVGLKSLGRTFYVKYCLECNFLYPFECSLRMKH